MFSSYDFKRFGSELRTKRNKLKLSQKAVSESTGIHQDTLRRIENGLVIPKYETIEVLSKLYRTDLLLLLQSLRSDYELENLYMRMDRAIQTHHSAELFDLENELQRIKTDKKKTLVNERDLECLEIFVKTSRIYHNEPSNIHVAREIILETLSPLDVNQPIKEDKSFDLLELRLLILLAVILMEGKEFKASLNLQQYVLSVLVNEVFTSQNIIQMVTTTYSNIAYCYHMIDQHSEALAFACKGIEYANSHYSSYGIHFLLVRKGVAELFLKDDQYLDTMKKLKHILEVMNLLDNLSLYAEIFKEKYDIDLYAL